MVQVRAAVRRRLEDEDFTCRKLAVQALEEALGPCRLDDDSGGGWRLPALAKMVASEPSPDVRLLAIDALARARGHEVGS